MDRLDRLMERLLDALDRQADLPSRNCLGLAVLEQFATGGLDLHARERVETHLNDCLACLNRYVELRDDLRGITATEPASPFLRRTLEELIAEERRETFPARAAESLRRALVFRVPAWAAAAVAAGIMLITWALVYNLQQPGVRVEWPFPGGTDPERLTPAHSQVPRTVSGVVTSIRDATANGVEAHVVRLKDAAGATYVFFAWGRPTVGPGESVEIDGILTGPTESAGRPLYQGVATALRRAR